MWKQRTSGYRCENKGHQGTNVKTKDTCIITIERKLRFWLLDFLLGVCEALEGKLVCGNLIMQLLGWHGFCAAVICRCRLVMHCFSYFPVRRDMDYLYNLWTMLTIIWMQLRKPFRHFLSIWLDLAIDRIRNFNFFCHLKIWCLI